MPDNNDKNHKNQLANNTNSTPISTKINKKSMIVIIILITVLVSGLFLNKILTNNENPSACLDRSDGSLLFNANLIFKESTTAVTPEQINSLVEQVKSIDGYENGANCLYPIIYSYISEGNYDKADDEYDNFAKAYGDGENFAHDIYPMNSLEELKNLIDFSLKNSINTNTTPKGVILLGEPVQADTEKANQ